MGRIGAGTLTAATHIRCYFNVVLSPPFVKRWVAVRRQDDLYSRTLNAEPTFLRKGRPAIGAIDEALAYLQSFPDWERGTAGDEETYTLDRMRRLLDLLGRPDRAYPIVHVVGTKGKGSTAAMLAAILRAAGYHTGLFTSPHLVDYRERVQVDGYLIPPADLAAIVDERLRPAVERLRVAGERAPLHFELLCALAFEQFRRRSVDVAVVEAGLGGRLDATNAVAETALTAITTLGYDHMAVLGDTLTAIAGEKAAVIRPGGLVASSPQPDEALDVVDRVCRERGARLSLVGRDWRVEGITEERDRTVFTARGPAAIYERLCVPLAGAYQAINAATAVAALDLLRARLPRLDEAALRRGLAATRWPGRLQSAGRDPLILLDGAHNRESAEALAGALGRLYPGLRFVLVVAVFRGKDTASILAPLLPLAEGVIVAAADHPRALPARTLARASRSLIETLAGAGTWHAGATPPEVEEAASIPDALQRARASAGAQGCILVTGSLRTVAEAMAALGIMGGDEHDS